MRFVVVMGLLVACGAPAAGERQAMPDPLATVPGEELFLRGKQVAQVGDHLRAEQYFAAAINRGYPQAEVMPYLLRACLAGGRLSSALQHAEPFLRRHPQEWALRYLVATLHIGLGDPHAARAELERVIQDAPEDPSAYYTLGMLLHGPLDDPNQSRGYLERYLELDPTGEHAPEVRAVLDRHPRIERLEERPEDIPEPVQESDEGEPG